MNSSKGNDFFELIAIKPLADCDKKYCKVLKPDEYYYFTSNYEIDGDIISYNPSLPSTFFYQGEIKIQLSAIVGKNGSGKSSIVDLLMMAINNVANYFSKNRGVLEKRLYWANEEEKETLAVEIYFRTDIIRVLHIRNEQVGLYEFEETPEGLKRLHVDKLPHFSLESFFYSIIVNHSHFGLDSDYLGKWLTELFHKNDGYQIPIVINPYRDGGSINIKREHSLVKARMLTNLGSNSIDLNYQITDNQKIVGVYLKLVDINFSEKALYAAKIPTQTERRFWEQPIEEVTITNSNVDKEDVLTRLNSVFNFGYDYLDKEAYRNALDYLVYKLVRIAINYSVYEGCYLYETKAFDENLIDDYLKEICFKGDSHITYKFRQTLNFLKYKQYQLESKTIRIAEFIEILNNTLGQNNIPELKRIEFIPPPIFHVDYQLSPLILGDEIEGSVSFDLLSSGDKQLVYSLNSILYHLRNVNSVNKSKLIKYKHVSVVFEEIEMYFHPDLQRKFIKQLLDGVRSLKLQAMSIHFCFITHSPFILSDIPDSNIMRLMHDRTLGYSIQDRQSGVKTFGSNIHTLLKDSFFMDRGMIGEFAKEKIQLIIDWLKMKEWKSSNLEREFLVVPILELKISESNYYTITNWQNVDVVRLIEIVGEPIVKKSLFERYYKVTGDNSWVDKMISDLRNYKQ